MATAVEVALILLQLWTISSNVGASGLPEPGVVTGHAETLGTGLNNFLNRVTGIGDLRDAYQNKLDSGDLTLSQLNAAELTDAMAIKLSELLKKKTAALKESVAWAEQLAKNYTWQTDLEKVTYVNAKTLDESDFEFNELFQKRVSFENSSVHIPVEIYEGDIEILNGLAWTSGLDEQWRKNRQTNPELLWQFFGSQTGIMRNFPASAWVHEDVDLYDVRRRPWYTQGASSPKDMLILVDTSGSTHGQALSLMKQAVKSLLDTLGENDFVNVAQFSGEASLVGCFQTFVQANFRHKQRIYDFVDQLCAKGMASYTAGFEFAFERFIEFYNTSDPWEGARCNPIIMFLTDGGTEMPEDVFQEYNWPDKKIRIFSYAVGPTAGPTEAAEWISCKNRGYFARIPSMGAIRSTVQGHVPIVARPLGINGYRHETSSPIYLDALEHVPVVARPLALNTVAYIQWSNVYQDQLSIPTYIDVLARSRALAYIKEKLWTDILLDRWGLGMMTTVTLPVYNRTEDVANQTILGVMGIDVTTNEMQNLIPKRMLGPNGYAFAINNNGYIVFHPGLKAQNGWLADPPNVDILDVEFENRAKELLRASMIDNSTGQMNIVSKVVSPDEMHIDEITLIYAYQGVSESNFSLAFAIPENNVMYPSAVSVYTDEEGFALLRKNDTAILLSNCYILGPIPTLPPPLETEESDENMTTTMGPTTAAPTLPPPPGLEDFTEISITSDCDTTGIELLQQLYFDAEVSEAVLPKWLNAHENESAIVALFVSTHSGLMRVLPHSEEDLFENERDNWEAQFYRRALSNDYWIFSASYNDGNLDKEKEQELYLEEMFWGGSLNISAEDAPTVLVSKAVRLDSDSFSPAVVGVRLNLDGLRDIMFSMISNCQTTSFTCYLLDDSAYVMVANDEELDSQVGAFLGDVDVALMSRLFNVSVFHSTVEYDFQASCVRPSSIYNAGIRSIYIPNFFNMFFDMLNLSWWTSKLSWLVININIYGWFSGQSSQPVYADETGGTVNRSCIKKLTQYYIANPEKYGEFICGNCSRSFRTAAVPNTNMLLVVTNKDTCGDCEGVLEMDSLPVETDDPLFAEGECEVLHRYRTRPSQCFDYDIREDDTDCGGGSRIVPSFVVSAVTSLLVLVSTYRLC